jgi:V-type H+-transporting ATPase subunit H
MKNFDYYTPLLHYLENPKHASEVSDKAAWILSALVGHLPGFFTDNQVNHVLTTVQVSTCSELGIMEAIVNLLKADQFRSCIWSPSKSGVKNLILQPSEQSTPVLYKSVFAIWILSGDQAICEELKEHGIVKKLRDIIANHRVEKIVRLTLMVIRNFLHCKSLCEDIVESNVLDTIQGLEFEKWRDAELYEDIRDMSSLISNMVQEMSNFERYERELNTGKLSWGFVHSSKFWGENVMKFDQHEFRAVKTLAAVLLSPSSSVETLAVACFDVGQFVSLHPLGKRKVAELKIKDRVMVLMAAGGDDKREVRREALLCCQKIMLNKWQEVADKGK